MAAIYDTAQIASISGVLENPTSRKKQLLLLHDSVRKSSRVLCEAVTKDLGWVDHVTTAAINHVLGAIETIYPEVSLSRELNLERNISAGDSAYHRELPLGLILVIGSENNPIGSVLLPLVGALAAGSDSILVQPERTRNTSAAINSILRETVDHEGVQTVSASVLPFLLKKRFDVAIIPPEFDVRRLQPLQSANPIIRILQPGSGLVAAIVDRSADLHSASIHLQNAIWKSGSSDLYGSPRLVLVDEFVLEDLKEHMLARLKGDSTYRVTKTSARPATQVLWISKRGRDFLPATALVSSLNVDILKGLLEVTSKSSEAIALIPTTSTDHALDLLNGINSKLISPVTYVFAATPEVRFFSRFLHSQTTIGNAIPIWALVNWMPQTAMATPSLPFSPHDLSSNHPVDHHELVRYESDLPKDFIRKTVLKDVKRKQLGLGPSFFEKGIAIGAVGALGLLGSTVYLAVRGFTTALPFIKSHIW